MIFLGIGSNLPSSFGNRFYNIDLAINFLNAYGIKVIKQSSYYETESYPNKNDPKFINIVISINTELNPTDLMTALIFIEEKLERRRLKKNSPPTCDIDIIDYNSQIINFNYNNLNLKIPHEKLELRNFVLLPVKEIFPEWKHPKTEVNVTTLISNLSDEDRKSIYKIKKS